MQFEKISYTHPDDKNGYTYDADVAIVGNDVELDEYYPFDERIFFYFTQDEWDQFKLGHEVPGIDFKLAQHYVEEN